MSMPQHEQEPAAGPDLRQRAQPGLRSLGTRVANDRSRPNRWSRVVAVDIVAAIDALCVLIGGLIAKAIVHSQPHGLGGVVATFEIALIAAVCLHFTIRHFGLYEPRDMKSFPAHPGLLLAALFLALSMMTSVTLALGVQIELPGRWLTCWFLISGVLLVAERMAARRFLGAAASAGLFDCNVAVFGSGRIADVLADYLDRNESDICLKGVYDDRTPDRLGDPDLRLSGDLDDLVAAGRRGEIDQIVIALPANADRRITDIAMKLEQLPVKVQICSHIASDIIESRNGRHRVSSLGPLGLVEVKSKPISDWGPLVKRAADVVISGAALLALCPLFLVIAAAIKLDSEGPVFFRQRRHGLNHKVIEVLKFRSMRVQEDGAIVKQATKNDPRVTRVGGFLRKTSLDELPQLINIFLGDMSLVGPRPHALVHNEYYGEMLERYANRHQVRPGLTGWAQINGARGETQTPEQMRRRVELDLYYIDNWSFWLDLKILAVTPVYGFTHQNAY